MDNEDFYRWNFKTDVYRSSSDFSDLLKIIATYYEMYVKAVDFLGPFISKQFGNSMFFAPSKEQIESGIGKQRPSISFKARTAFIDSLINFLVTSKGKKALIYPSISSHHSAQFPFGTFNIEEIQDSKIQLREDKILRKETKQLFKIEFANASSPVYVENLPIPISQINFLIIRPKLGKLGMPSTTKWEVLVYKKNHGYIINHVDSHLNPKYSGRI